MGSIMRGTVFVLSFAATCFAAQASSFVTLGGEPAATPSIIALGEPAPGVSDDKVAAIPKMPEKAPSEAWLPPMVIRGGIVGGLSADPVPAPVHQEPTAVATQPLAAPQQAAASADASPSAGESAPAAPASTPLRKPI